MDGAWSTVIICIVLALFCVFAVRSYIKKLKHGCCGAGSDEVKRVRPPDKDKSHYPYVCRIGIDSMSCKNCAMRIENTFHEREGYYAKVDLKKQSAIVWMKRPVPENELKELVRQAGYRAVSLETMDVQV